MAISTIKYDENGRPKRAKYRIVALGNLEHVHWNRGDVYAPVLSMVELRLLTSFAVRNRCRLKSGDIKQAFVQASLPHDEIYVVRPPKGYTQTHPNDTSINLSACRNAPCIFHGNPLPNKPPLYVGVYMDDFIYFSTDPDVEQG